MGRYRVKFSEIEDYSKEDWIIIIDTICRHVNSKIAVTNIGDVLAMLGIDQVEEAETEDNKELKELFGIDNGVEPC